MIEKLQWPTNNSLNLNTVEMFLGSDGQSYF